MSTKVGGYTPSVLTATTVLNSVIPFNDAPIKRIPASSVVNSSSLDTTATDPYRQGVELTLPKHFVMGTTIKIHSGEENNFIRPSVMSLGEDYTTTRRTRQFFEEEEKFSPVSYLNGTRAIDSVVQEAEDLTPNFRLDPVGVTRPRNNSFIQTYRHERFYATLQDGNESAVGRSSDQVVSIYETNVVHNTLFDDVIRKFVGLPIGERISDIGNNFPPFNELNDVPLLTDNDMCSVIRAMKPETDTFIPNGSRSATCGFVYDGSNVSGTDSLSFGGSERRRHRRPYINIT